MDLAETRLGELCQLGPVDLGSVKRPAEPSDYGLSELVDLALEFLHGLVDLVIRAGARMVSLPSKGLRVALLFSRMALLQLMLVMGDFWSGRVAALCLRFALLPLKCGGLLCYRRLLVLLFDFWDRLGLGLDDFDFVESSWQLFGNSIFINRLKRLGRVFQGLSAQLGR